MTNAPTIRETADHAELARLADAATPGPWFAWTKSRTLQIDTRGGDGRLPAIINWPGFDGNDMSHGASKANARFIAAANPATVLSLLSEIAALRGERDRLHAEADENGLLAYRLTQAERQRDEAVGLLRELADGRSQKNNINEYDDLSVRASTLLANQGADQ